MVAMLTLVMGSICDEIRAFFGWGKLVLMEKRDIRLGPRALVFFVVNEMHSLQIRRHSDRSRSRLGSFGESLKRFVPPEHHM